MWKQRIRDEPHQSLTLDWEDTASIRAMTIYFPKQKIFVKSHPPSIDSWLRMCDSADTATLEENWENARGFLAADNGEDRWCPYIAMVEDELDRRKNAVKK